MDKINIGVIGAGMRSGLAKHWHKPEENTYVAAVADISNENMDEFKNKVNPNCDTFNDYKELLNREDIDAVAITTPDYLHEEHATAALEAGKHVYCEKPLAITDEGCNKIIETAKKTGNHLMVGFNMRYMPMFQTMKGIVDSGKIGDIKAVWVRHFVGLGGYFYYLDWHAYRENTTSLLLQKGSHDIDIIHWITGAYTEKVSAFGGLDFFGDSRPDQIDDQVNSDYDKLEAGDIDERAFRKDIDVEDNNVVIMQLENGIKASYLQCHFTPDYHRNYTFIGTKGRMENSEPDGEVYVKTRKSDSWEAMSNQVYNVKDIEGGHGGSDPLICNDFINLIRYGKQPKATPLDGRMSVATGCAAAESMRSNGKVMKVNQVNKS